MCSDNISAEHKLEVTGLKKRKRKRKRDKRETTMRFTDND
jgi:hypothetical protein